MKLTTKGRYAVTALIDIAMHGDKYPVSLSELSKRQDISAAYLEQLAAKLRAANLLHSVRGAKGGYKLAMPARNISIADIILAIEEPMDTTKCKGRRNCKNGSVCITHHLWVDLNKVIDDFLSRISVESLVLKYKEEQKSEALANPYRVNLNNIVAVAE